MDWTLDAAGRMIARYLDRPAAGYEPFTPSEPAVLQAMIQPGDVLLVEGNTHISGVIKYLTQSTWSHAALYVGPMVASGDDDTEPHTLIEANLGEGVVAVPISKYFKFHTRICRPVGLSRGHCEQVCRYAIARISFRYDLKNIFDLVRYLVPLPVPQCWRRRMIALGSGDPTQLICSGMIAQAFQSVRYPILPKITLVESGSARREIMEIRHSSLFVPRDFDISPYFAVVKPTIEQGFDYRTAVWTDMMVAEDPAATDPRSQV